MSGLRRGGETAITLVVARKRVSTKYVTQKLPANRRTMADALAARLAASAEMDRQASQAKEDAVTCVQAVKLKMQTAQNQAQNLTDVHDLLDTLQREEEEEEDPPQDQSNECVHDRARGDEIIGQCPRDANQTEELTSAKDDQPRDENIDDEVSASAALRIQTARLRAMEEEVKQLRADLTCAHETVASAQKLAQEERQLRLKIERNEKNVKTALDKEKGVAQESKDKIIALENDLTTSKQEAASVAKELKAMHVESRAREVRLNRATDELERYRAQLRELRSARDGVALDVKQESQRLAAELSRMRKRQTELLLAFRKQARLIDVLKRQKLHAEASCLLGFTEQEFTRCIELGEELVA